MGINKNVRRLAFILFTTAIMVGCGKNCVDTTYSFNISAVSYPDKDSISIGDTVWVEINTPATQLDNISNTTVDYSGATNMGIAIQLLSFHGGSVSDPGATYTLDSFHYIIKNGSLASSGQFANNYKFDEISNTYRFKLGIIPIRTGTYGLSISDAVNVYRQNDKCTKATFTISYAQTDQHLYLYQDNRPGYDISSYERTHSYFFKVY